MRSHEGVFLKPAFISITVIDLVKIVFHRTHHILISRNKVQVRHTQK